MFGQDRDVLALARSRSANRRPRDWSSSRGAEEGVQRAGNLLSIRNALPHPDDFPDVCAISAGQTCMQAPLVVQARFHLGVASGQRFLGFAVAGDAANPQAEGAFPC
jgi:hypothetical protein